MLQQVDDLAPRPHRVRGVARAEQPGHTEAEIFPAEVHQHQGEQEGRHGHADEAQQREPVVAERVGPDRRVDADRQGDQPGDEDGQQGDHEREHEPVAEDFVDRQVALHRAAQIALQQAGIGGVEGHEPGEAHPVRVALPRRLVEAEGLPEVGELGLGVRVARHLDLQFL